MRCTDAHIFSQAPESGVYQGLRPWRHIHSTISGVLCPARFSSTSSIRQGGGACGHVIFTARPSCPLSHIFWCALRLSAGRAGRAATSAARASCSHPCRTTFVQRCTPRARQRPLCGCNRVTNCAVPSLTYSCGWRRGCPSSSQLWPATGTVEKGPASSSVHTARPLCSPVRYARSIQFFSARRLDQRPGPLGRPYACAW
jgi:hypothetical protein